MKAAKKSVIRGKIRDAVVDPEGQRWINWGSRKNSVWFSLYDLQVDEKSVLARVGRVGTVLLSHQTRNTFKTLIEKHIKYRPGVVAGQPGWCDKKYVHGDGSITGDDGTEIIIGFEPQPKFKSVGSLADWQQGVGRVVKNQPLPLTVLCSAFVGPLLAFAPAAYANPILELDGDPQLGKTSLEIAAASVWAGDPASTIGGADSFDLTLGVLDYLKRLHNHGLLVLDEAHMAATSKNAREELLPQAIRKLERSGEKLRYDQTRSKQSRLMTVFTTNTAMSVLVPPNVPERDAVLSRILSLHVPTTGVFDFVPAGFSSGREAIEALVATTSSTYGVAGPAYIKGLQKNFSNGGCLLDHVPALINLCAGVVRELSAVKLGARIEKAIALKLAAGLCAQFTGVIPASFGNVTAAIPATVRTMTGQPKAAEPRAMERIREYMQRHARRIIKLDELESPLDYRAFVECAACLIVRDGSAELMIPDKKFRSEFPDYGSLVRELRASGHARTENGKQPKLTIKSPRALCAKGRVYCLRLSQSDLKHATRS